MAQQSSFGQFMKANNTPRSQRYATRAERLHQTNFPAPPAETSTVPPDSPFYDRAKNILMPAALDQDTKASAWDSWHLAKTSADLSQRLQGLTLPADVHGALIDAKKLSDPVPTNVDKVTAAITRMSKMDPRTLEIAENHSNVLKAFLAGSGD